jgi:hypothetical protein
MRVPVYSTTSCFDEVLDAAGEPRPSFLFWMCIARCRCVKPQRGCGAAKPQMYSGCTFVDMV